MDLITKRHQVIMIFIVALGLCIQITGCRKSEPNTEMISGEKEVKRLPRVKVEEVVSASFTKTIELIGIAKARISVKVGTDESGVIRKVAFEKGDNVMKGAVLVEIDDSVLRSSLAELEASFDIAELNYDKLAALKKGKGAVSDVELRNAALQKEMAKARVEALKARLEKMRIKSSITGIIEKKYVEPGEFIAPGSVVANIIDISEIKVETGIAENDIGFFKKGSEAQIVFDAYPNRKYSSHIEYLADSADPSNGTFLAEIPIDNRDGLIKPGLLARISLVKGKCGKCILVDQDAVIQIGSDKAVFIIDEERRARLRSVVLGDTDKGRIVVTKGLKEGDLLVVVGNRGIVDGERVEILE